MRRVRMRACVRAWMVVFDIIEVEDRNLRFFGVFFVCLFFSVVFLFVCFLL